MRDYLWVFLGTLGAGSWAVPNIWSGFVNVPNIWSGFFDGRKFVPVFYTYQHHRSVTY
jgi:hypothetical protein